MEVNEEGATNTCYSSNMLKEQEKEKKKAENAATKKDQVEQAKRFKLDHITMSSDSSTIVSIGGLTGDLTVSAGKTGQFTVDILSFCLCL